MSRSPNKPADEGNASRIARPVWDQLIANSSLPVLALDREGRIYHAASSIESLFHAEPGSLAGLRLADKLDAQGAESLAIHLERVFTKRQMCSCELRFDIPGHGALWLKLSSQPDDGIQDAVLCWSWIENITAGRQAEHQEASVRRMARAALKSGTVREAGNKILDTLCSHEHAHAGCVALLDEQHATVHYASFLDEGMVCPEPHAPHGGLAGHLLSSGQVIWWNDLWSAGKSGGPLFDYPRTPPPSDLIGVPLKSGRSVTGFLLAYKTRPGSVFSQREVELMIAAGSLLESVILRSKVKEVEASLVSSIQQAPEPVLVTDRRGVVEYVNPAFEKITGYDAGEILGSPVSILKSGRHEPGFYRELWGTLLAGKPWRGHFINRDKQGKLFEADTVIWPLKDRGGEIARYAAINHVLDSQGEVAALDQADVDSTLFNRVVSVFTHDFRNTLLSIRMNADLLRPASGVGARDEIENIADASEQAEALLDNIAALTAPVSRVLRDVDINQQVHRTQALAAKLLGTSRRLIAELEPRLDRIRIPAGIIEKVMTGLLFYAQRVTPSGHALLVRTFRDLIHEEDRPYFTSPPPPDRFYYSVLEFSGSGLAAGFIRGSGSSSVNDQDVEWASGLPDLILRVLGRHGFVMVRQMAGDQGLVRIYFEAASPRALMPERAEPSTSNAVEVRASETVLVAEDDPGARRVMRRILEAQGYRVIEAENGATAVRMMMFNERKVDLLLADVMMPDFDGKTLADQIANLNPSIRILYVSGFDAEELERQNITLGVSADKLVKKPFSRDELLAKVRLCLHGV